MGEPLRGWQRFLASCVSPISIVDTDNLTLATRQICCTQRDAASRIDLPMPIYPHDYLLLPLANTPFSPRIQSCWMSHEPISVSISWRELDLTLAISVARWPSANVIHMSSRGTSLRQTAGDTPIQSSQPRYAKTASSTHNADERP